MAHKKITNKKRILLLGAHPFSFNRGCAAMCMASIEIIKKYIPDALITIGGYFVDYGDLNASLYMQKYGDSQYIRIEGLESGFSDKTSKIKRCIKVTKSRMKLTITVGLCVLWRFFKYFGIETSRIFCKNRLFKQFYNSDVIVDLKWGHQLTYVYSTSNTSIWFSESLIPILLNKPYIFFPQTIGAFKHRFACFLAKLILNRVKIIMVREKKSEECVLKMGIDHNKIFLLPDTAFYLDPVAQEDIDVILNKENVCVGSNLPLVGISLEDISMLPVLDKSVYKKYIKIIVQVADHMQKKYGCAILLIPHDGGEASKHVYEEFLNKIKNKKNIFYLKNKNYSTEELRGIIGKCDLFISSYLHASISALSMCVPTINFAYSYKAIGVFGLLGLEKYVLDLKDLTYEKTISVIEDAWNNREKIRKKLEAKIPEVKKRVMFAGELVKDILDEQEPI